ncbi:MAG: hypothetical protein IJC15_04270, partial [Clostridia bacterium]|nr:hypothetical protein [Clostridia bacterium]
TTEAGQGQTGVYLPVIPGMPVSSSALTGTLTETLTEMPPAAVETRPSASVRPTPGTTAPNARPSAPAITLDDEILLRAVYILWGAGSVVSLLWFGGSAVTFALRLRRSRRPCGRVGRTRVWVSETIDTPCLAGFPPAVYLTPAAADTSAKAMVLWHEYRHLRQGDWLWAPLRTLVLCLYWFNPLVWAVVACTKQDAELACDEAVAAQLDEAGRLRYARMIVDMLPPVPSRAVGFGAGTVRERILMLTTERKNRILAAVLALVLVIGAVGCSFVAPNPVSRAGDDPSVTNDPTHTDAVQLSEQITLQSSTGELTFRVLDLPAVPGEYDVFPYDDRYQLYHVRGEAPTLYLFDPETGTFAADCAMPYNGRLASVSYTDDGLILYDYTRQDAAFAVSYTKGVLRVRETEVPSEVRSLPIVSPNGLYRVCAVTDAAGKGGIDLITADGGVRRIIPHESGSLNTPLAFRDGTSFYYQIGARLPQLAVYDILSGNSTPVWHEDAQQLLGTYGGTVYFGRMMDDDIPVSLGSSRGEGSTSVSYVFTEAERSLYAPFDR